MRRSDILSRLIAAVAGIIGNSLQRNGRPRLDAGGCDSYIQ